MEFLVRHLEALIFCSPSPLSVGEMQSALSEMFDAQVSEADIHSAIGELQNRYAREEYAFEVIRVGGGYQFLTKAAYQPSISILLKQKSKKRLSTSAMETLAIIAYRQPVTKSEIEAIRGVNCDYAIQKLLEKELVAMAGKAESVGRPLLYATSEQFLEYFGINSLAELPTLRDLQPQEGNQIGEVQE